MGEQYESKEYDRLVGRNFRPYSAGHRNMYHLAIAGMKAARPKSNVFEAGVGIGWGLGEMVKAGVLREYMGTEPNADSLAYTRTTLPSLASGVSIHLHGDEFNTAYADGHAEFGGGGFDEALCIEVIEHVPLSQQLQFLIDLKRMAPRLWLSTPDSTKSKEGVRPMRDWVALIKQAQFKSVKVNTDNWTYLYECA